MFIVTTTISAIYVTYVIIVIIVISIAIIATVAINFSVLVVFLQSILR